MGMITILSPGPEATGETGPALAARAAALSGAVVGIVNNSWRCMDLVASELTERLVRDHGVAEILEERVSAAQTVPPDRLDALAARSDAAIVGMGN